jgi:hypothetical protein
MHGGIKNCTVKTQERMSSTHVQKVETCHEHPVLAEFDVCCTLNPEYGPLYWACAYSSFQVLLDTLVFEYDQICQLLHDVSHGESVLLKMGCQNLRPNISQGLGSSILQEFRSQPS